MTDNTNAADPITTSPFYRLNKTTLPTGAPVEPGGLYVMDDEGGIVFQLSQTAAQQPTGTLNTQEGKAAVSASDQLALAISFKKDHCVNSAPNTVKIDTPLIINTLVNVNQDRVPLGQGFTINKGTINEFYLYNVHDQNGQLLVLHITTPIADKGQTLAVIHGLVYVESKNGDVYIGYLNIITLIITDQCGAFRPPF